MPSFKFWAAVYAACASLPMFAHSIVREEVWAAILWAAALVYSISVVLFVVSNWCNWRGVRKRIRSGDGNLLPAEYLEMRFSPPTELSNLDKEAIEWEIRSKDNKEP